jgi:hypothetical protein
LGYYFFRTPRPDAGRAENDGRMEDRERNELVLGMRDKTMLKLKRALSDESRGGTLRSMRCRKD